MKILLATDGSPCSEEAVNEVANRPWPEGSEIRILSIAETPLPITPTPDSASSLLIDELEQFAQNRAHAAIEKAEALVRENRSAGLKITSELLAGSPKELLLNTAVQWGADLIVVGSHGFRRNRRLMAGSVAQTVAAQAPCSVTVVPCRGSAGF